MVGLLDIADKGGAKSKPVKTVKIRGKDVSIPGVDARGVVALIGHYPVAEKLFGGRGAKEEDLKVETLLALAPDLVTDIIVLGTGDRTYSEETVAAANSLALAEQADLLAAIVEVTMPSGVGPFIESLNRMVGAMGLDTVDSIKVPGTK